MHQLCDLHLHSNASDGQWPYEFVIDHAVSKGIHYISLTNHDTLMDLSNAQDYANNQGVKFIKGIEIEATYPGQMHILGYFFDPNSSSLVKLVKSIQEDREIRNQHYIEIFNNLGICFSLEDLKKFAFGQIIGKPHFASLLLSRGFTSYYSEAFSKYFDLPEFNEFNKGYHPPEEVISAIKSSGGLAVLAHPKTLKIDDASLLKVLIKLKSFGLDGVECYHSTHTIEKMQIYRQMAMDLSLIYTKGSDFHGPGVKKDIELGSGINGNLVLPPDEELIIISNLYNRFESQH